MLTPNQRKVIQVARQKLKLTDENYHDILSAHGLQSSKDESFTNEKFRAVMASFEKLGFAFNPQQKSRDGFATIPQIEMLKRLWRQNPAVKDPQDASLLNFIDRIIKVRNFDMIPRGRVQYIVKAISSLGARK
jgi:hypothetical protein